MGANTIPFWAAHSYMAYIREYVYYIGGLDPSFYARRSGQILQNKFDGWLHIQNRPEGLGPNNTVKHWLNQKQSIKIRSTWSSLINSFYLNPTSLSLNEYTWCNTNFICSCIVGSIMRLFYFIKSRPRLLSRGYNLCTFPPIVANISCGALVSLDTTTVIDISLRKELTYTIFYLWSSRNPAKRFCSYFSS